MKTHVCPTMYYLWLSKQMPGCSDQAAKQGMLHQSTKLDRTSCMQLHLYSDISCTGCFDFHSLVVSRIAELMLLTLFPGLAELMLLTLFPGLAELMLLTLFPGLATSNQNLKTQKHGQDGARLRQLFEKENHFVPALFSGPHPLFNFCTADDINGRGFGRRLLVVHFRILYILFLTSMSSCFIFICQASGGTT